VDAGKLIGVEVLDHIIVGDGRDFSFREGGWL
jgi:DNA repair protein RadC